MSEEDHRASETRAEEETGGEAGIEARAGDGERKAEVEDTPERKEPEGAMSDDDARCSTTATSAGRGSDASTSGTELLVCTIACCRPMRGRATSSQARTAPRTTLDDSAAGDNGLGSAPPVTSRNANRGPRRVTLTVDGKLAARKTKPDGARKRSGTSTTALSTGFTSPRT